MSASRCRFCEAELRHVFADLGQTPLANSYRSERELAEMEPFYPLRALVCEECFLVQLDEYETPDVIFSEYAYFSSYSDSWLAHARDYVEMATERFGLGPESHVLEVASNDGYLLQYFVERGIPVLGVEPAANVAEVAERNGIRTTVKFFGRATAREISATMLADLVIANNVLAHVPDLNDFVAGFKRVLAPGGTVTVEFPHLMRLIEKNEFDTIYHEHFSYFSFLTVQRVFEAHGLVIHDVEELPTHGGSLRIYGRHAEDESRPVSDAATELAGREREAGFERIETYLSFAEGVKRAKWELLDFLIAARREGKRVVAYGAPAKGNTLLNYCGIGTEEIEFTVDRNPHKQGRYLPGTQIPIREPEAIREARPDLILILPWNLRAEIAEQLSFVGEWGGRFVVRTPELEVFDPVIFNETPIGGAFLIQLEPLFDERGWFARTFDREEFSSRGLAPAVIQCNTSFNERAGTLRGMHLQAEPHGEPKLVRCTRGGVFDVIVDVRPDSPTHRDWYGVELTPDNGRMLYIPVGVAHGFQTLADDSEVGYQMGHEYVADSAVGVRWDDPAFGIEWPDPPAERVISERDAAHPDYAGDAT